MHADLPDDVQAVVVSRERGWRVAPEAVEREADELPIAPIRSDERRERDHVRGEIDHAGIGYPPQARMVAHQIDGQDRATRGVAPATDLHREARLPRPAASDELDDHRWVAAGRAVSRYTASVAVRMMGNVKRALTCARHRRPISRRSSDDIAR